MTLVELLVASGISAIIGLSSTSLFVHSAKVTRHASLFNQVTGEASLISETIASDVRHAASLEYSLDSFVASDKTLILKIPSIDSDENVIDVENTFDYIIYHPGETADSNVVVREVRPHASSSRLQESKVLGFDVRRSGYTGTFLIKPDALGAYVVHFRLTPSRSFQDNTYEMPISGSVRLRNKN